MNVTNIQRRWREIQELQNTILNWIKNDGLSNLGTELQHQYRNGTGFPRKLPYGSQIRGHHQAPLRKVMLLAMADLRLEVSIVGSPPVRESQRTNHDEVKKIDRRDS
jgi:hypothetical protein